MPATRGSGAAALSNCEHSLGLYGIVSAVAPWIAPEQTPPREHSAPKYAVLPDRFDCIPRARRLVLATAGDRGGDKALVEDDRRRSHDAHRRRPTALLHCDLYLAHLCSTST